MFMLVYLYPRSSHSPREGVLFEPLGLSLVLQGDDALERRVGLTTHLLVDRQGALPAQPEGGRGEGIQWKEGNV
jgi:hypothetical protein